MILVLTGTHQQQFNRLLEAVDALALPDVIAQTGHSTFQPRGTCHQSLPFEDVQRLLREADIVICHAGTGTVMSALAAGKCPVVAPRFVQFGEHVDNHQIELVAALAENDLIIPWLPGNDLAAALEQARGKNTLRQAGPAPALVEHLHQAVLRSASRRART